MRSEHQRWFWILVGLFGGTDLLSWISFQNLSIMPYVYGALLLAVVGLGWRWPWLPALMVVAELVVGGKGYLWFLSVGEVSLSFRLGLFIVTLLVTFAYWFRNRPRLRLPTWPWVGVLSGWIMVMSGVGFIRGYDWSDVFFDVNGFLFLGSLVSWSVLLPTKSQWRDWILIVLLAGVTYLGLKTWFMTYVFSHQPDAIDQIYRWIRNSGVGEVTRVQAPVYRVFFQSHIYSLMVFLLTLGAFLWARAPRWWLWPMLASGLGMYLSLSRSIWLGLGVASLILVTWSIRAIGWKVLARWLIVVPVAAAIWMLSLWAIEWPYVFPNVKTSRPNLVVTRLTDGDAHAASNARLNQLPVLQEAILQSPIFGHGFGKSLTYQSTDPRVRGARTTTAFELGYFDLVLKFGLVGLGLFGIWIFSVFRLLRQSSQPWLWIGGSAALMVVHMTTPYLNHPLGLGWLVLISIYAHADGS